MRQQGTCQGSMTGGRALLLAFRIVGPSPEFKCTKPKFVSPILIWDAKKRESGGRVIFPNRKVVSCYCQPTKLKHVAARFCYATDLRPCDLPDFLHVDS